YQLHSLSLHDALPIFHNYIVSYAGRAIGLVQWNRLGDFPLQMNGYEVTDPDVVNVDILIGDAAYVRRGLGAPLVRRFLDEIVFRSEEHTSELQSLTNL